MVLVHGVGAAPGIFHGVVERLASHHRTIVVDLVAAGLSAAALAPVSLAGLLARTMERAQAPRALVAGHSFGGLVALELAARHRERVAGLVVVSAPALGLPGRVKQALADEPPPWLLRLAAQLPRVPFMVRQYLQLLWGDPSRLTREQAAVYLAAMQTGGYFQALLAALRATGEYRLPVAKLKALEAPRLVLWGERDRLLSPVVGEQLAQAIGAELKVVPGAGHCLPEERPEVLAAEIERLTRAKSARSPGGRGKRGAT